MAASVPLQPSTDNCFYKRSMALTAASEMLTVTAAVITMLMLSSLP